MTFTKEEEALLERFFVYKEKHQYRKALSILDLFLPKHEHSSIINGLYGTIFYQIKDYRNSIKSSQKVIAENPTSELASLTIFHSFVKIGQPQKALDELFRYTEIADPKLYLTTIVELIEATGNDFSKANLKRLKKLYDKWC